jgi:hypothetical protein
VSVIVEVISAPNQSNVHSVLTSGGNHLLASTIVYLPREEVKTPVIETLHMITEPEIMVKSVPDTPWGVLQLSDRIDLLTEYGKRVSGIIKAIGYSGVTLEDLHFWTGEEWIKSVIEVTIYSYEENNIIWKNGERPFVY